MWGAVVDQDGGVGVRAAESRGRRGGERGRDGG